MSIGEQIYCKKHRRNDLDTCEECDKEYPVVKAEVRLYLNIDTREPAEGGEYSYEECLKFAAEEIGAWASALKRTIKTNSIQFTRFPAGVEIVDWEYEVEP